MITLPRNESLFVPHHNLQKLMYDNDLIAHLARQLVAGQVEAHIEIAHDCAKEYPTHAEAAAMIEGAKITVEDYIEDLLTGFRGELIEQVRKVEIEVKSTTFSAGGFEDAEVSVK